MCTTSLKIMILQCHKTEMLREITVLTPTQCAMRNAHTQFHFTIHTIYYILFHYSRLFFHSKRVECLSAASQTITIVNEIRHSAHEKNNNKLWIAFVSIYFFCFGFIILPMVLLPFFILHICHCMHNQPRIIFLHFFVVTCWKFYFYSCANRQCFTQKVYYLRSHQHFHARPLPHTHTHTHSWQREDEKNVCRNILAKQIGIKYFGRNSGFNKLNRYCCHQLNRLWRIFHSSYTTSTHPQCIENI